MSTQGDRVQDRALAEVGGKGLFVKELEVAMQEGRADIAVHSMKDVPSELPPGFCIAAVLPRANPLDAFISRRLRALRGPAARGARRHVEPAPAGAAAAARARTCSLELLRGNVDTRLRRLDEGEPRRDPARLRRARAARASAHHITEDARPRPVACPPSARA